MSKSPEKAEPRGASHPGRHLQDFYAVVIGVALVLAVEEIIDSSDASSPIDWTSLPLFLSFALLAFSYYHGSVRYLDVMYSDEGPELSRLRIYSDLFIGAIDTMLVIALSILISRPIYFLTVLTIMFVLEVLRVATLKRFLPSEQIFPLETDFMVIHLALIPIFAGIFFVARSVGSAEAERLVVGIPLLVLIVVRSIFSYRRSFELYFPQQTQRSD
jgi:hypothetical protein